MEQDIYKQLARQLDQYSVGFPATKSGIELKILQRLFTQEEAALFLDMSMLLETPESLAGRTGRDPEQTAGILAAMATKGLIFRLHRGDSVLYAAVPFVVGSYEYQLKNIDKELAELFEQYMQEGMLSGIARKVFILRSIPVNKALDSQLAVAPYDDARQFLANKKKIAVAKCLCRIQQGLLDKGCNKPIEVCFAFDSHADFYVENGMARYIGLQEALDILDTCEKAGLVNQPFNVVNPGGMCNCCGCCCGALRAMKTLPKPAEAVITSYYAQCDTDACTGCEICLDRCQMDAITMGEDGRAHVNRDRCIGCGLCVTTCYTEAMRLFRLPESERRVPPATSQDLMMQMAQERNTSLTPLKVLEAKK